jgi:hypothetical protein
MARGINMAMEPTCQGTNPSAELTPDDVQRLAQLLGLPIGPDDLPEVTYRLGALIEELDKLTHLELNQEEPIPLFPGAEEGRG